MGQQQSLNAKDVAQKTHVSVEEAEELLKSFMKAGTHKGNPINLEEFKSVVADVQHLYDSPAFAPEAAELYFNIFDTTHDGLGN